ncbi:SMI1/KNR4 family protein [Paenibacillus sp. FSL W7-1088]|uniref:SMI1/KNR4 family protein n=1 Tax=unclassified Paenibacillus TaxID=185978 RepID=UPI0015C66816|nr:SMI1/KNR4 family protein [Paenibacillus sp. E222]QLG39189.1 SMI1/KNR4 family protein [Paenibacillus sp. E222]
MATVYNTNKKIKLKNIEEFEAKYAVLLPVQYRDFLLEYNGGNVKPNVFKISDDEGETALNTLYGLDINESYDELSSVFDSLYGEIPNEFISIGDDSGGNQICLGTSEEYAGKIYIFLHDIEPTEKMSNMFLISDSFDSFLDNLYEV